MNKKMQENFDREQDVRETMTKSNPQKKEKK